jgi:hypothetical protein
MAPRVRRTSLGLSRYELRVDGRNGHLDVEMWAFGRGAPWWYRHGHFWHLRASDDRLGRQFEPVASARTLGELVAYVSELAEWANAVDAQKPEVAK